MGIPPLPQLKRLKPAYGFDEVAIVPGDVTVNPEQTNVYFQLGPLTFTIPILASAMDAVVDTTFAVLFSKLGGLPVLNLEGLYTRYEHPEEALEHIIQAKDNITAVLQQIYSHPVQERLIGERVQEIKRAGARCGVAVTPANTKHLAPLAVEAGSDVLVVQSTVTTARHLSRSERGLNFSELRQSISIPILVGNCVSYNACLELMRTGIDGVLVGVGPGAACTTREVLGVGVPQVTATMDCAAAREQHFRETGQYVALITDGGVRNGGDLCKAFAAGADAVMLGSILAQAEEAPGKGYHWGMATSHPTLPRGTRIKVGTLGILEQILFGPTTSSHGAQNLIGALRTALGVCGALTLRDFQKVELVLAPSIKTEGKHFQLTQRPD